MPPPSTGLRQKVRVDELAKELGWTRLRTYDVVRKMARLVPGLLTKSPPTRWWLVDLELLASKRELFAVAVGEGNRKSFVKPPVPGGRK